MPMTASCKSLHNLKNNMAWRTVQLLALKTSGQPKFYPALDAMRAALSPETSSAPH
jgi:hypothetical protein